MLTRETAIARLRATGTLSDGERGGQIVAMREARCPVAATVNKLMMSNARAAAMRHVAPAANQAVLP